jgi:undecaprenyl-diphosphatase
MDYIEAFFLGAVQGLTEFLPVSSSGHLTLAQHFLGKVSQGLTFEIAVHFGTVLSILIVYRKVIGRVLLDLLKFVRGQGLNAGTELTGYVVLASVPAAIVGIGFKSFFEELFSSLSVIAFGFFVTGTILFATKSKPDMSTDEDLFSISERLKIKWWQALVIGLAQAVAITPGISRSGSTIGAGLLVGLDRRTAALFSFMMAVPVILGAAVLELRHVAELTSSDIKALAIGVVTALVFGYLSLRIVVQFVKRGRVHYFGYYVWVLSAVMAVYIYLN